MANLTPTPGWDNVPQLEMTTPALGGHGGPMNTQAQALLNRTEALNLLFSGYVSVSTYGTIGDQIADDSTAFLNAIAAAIASGKKLVIPPPQPGKAYRITQTLNFRNIVVEGGGSTIYVDTTAIGVILGGDASSGTNPDQNIGTVSRNVSLAQTNPSVRVIGAKGQRIKAKYVDYMDIWADTTNAPDGSSAYSQFDIDWADTFNLVAGPNPGWINENKFYINRCHNMSCVGTSTFLFNHNRWIGGSFEGAASINFNYATDNKMLGLRFEQGPTTITFGANADRNTVMNDWASSEFSGWPNTPIISGTITNNGGPGNVVLKDQQTMREAVVVATSDVSDVVLNNTFSALNPENTRTTTLQYVGGTSGNVPVAMSDYLGIEANDYYVYNWENANSGDTVLYRGALYFYDANYQPITVQSGWVVSATVTSISSNVIRCSVGQLSGVFARITQAAITGGAVFVRAVIESSNTQLANALGRRLTVVLFSLNATQLRANMAARKQSRTSVYAVTAIPTQGYAPLGFMCVNTSFTARYHCTSTSDTTLTVAAAASATTITVASASQFANGDVLGINQDDRSTFWTTVSGAPSGNVVTLAAALPTTSANGSRVVRNRWRTETLSVS